MPRDNVSHTRDLQGRFATRLSRRLPPAAEAHRPPVRPVAPVVRIGNAHPVACAALLLVAAGLRSSRPLAPGREHSGGPPRVGLGLLPGAQAASHATVANAPGGEMVECLIPAPGALPGRGSGIEQTAAVLSSIGNAALSACVAAPRRCPQALLASSLAATATMAGAAVDTALEMLLQPERTAPAPARWATDAADGMLHQLPPDERRAILGILRNCGTGPACTEQIRAHLASLPLPVQDTLQRALDNAIASSVTPGASSGWPPSALAIVLPAPHSWVDAAVNLLEIAYDARQASYLLDLEQIAQATRDGQAGQPRGMREVAANQRRSATIEALFNATGHAVDRLPFNISAHDLRGVPRTAWGRNLLLTFNGPGAPAHRLMLVAHGDMTGTDTGSSGALDNGTGVATLLAMARELQDTPLPRGTQVQLLVTDLGERGMMGAKAYVQRCLSGQCPDVVLNLDMLGRGDGLAICGSDQRHLFIMDTQQTDQRQPGTVGAQERHLRQLLQAAATALHVPQHPARAWTQISDHLPFQREGIPALGLTRISAPDLAAEATLQATYAELLRRHAAVEWNRVDDYLNGRLGSADAGDMRERLAEHEAVSQRYRRQSRATYRVGVHDGHDQIDQIQTRAAMDTLAVVHHAVRAWLANPAG